MSPSDAFLWICVSDFGVISILALWTLWKWSKQS